MGVVKSMTACNQHNSNTYNSSDLDALLYSKNPLFLGRLKSPRSTIDSFTKLYSNPALRESQNNIEKKYENIIRDYLLNHWNKGSDNNFSEKANDIEYFLGVLRSSSKNADESLFNLIKWISVFKDKFFIPTTLLHPFKSVEEYDSFFKENSGVLNLYGIKYHNFVFYSDDTNNPFYFRMCESDFTNYCKFALYNGNYQSVFSNPVDFLKHYCYRKDKLTEVVKLFINEIFNQPN